MMTLRGIGHAANYAIGAASETQQYLKEKRRRKSGQSDSVGSSTEPRSSELPATKDTSNLDASSDSDLSQARSECESPDMNPLDNGAVDADSRDWELDDMEDTVEDDSPPNYDDAVRENNILDDATPEAAAGCKDHALPVPVILPQRRPQHRTRGFVRAYAPVLGEHKALDEGMFMEFVGQLNNVSKSSQVYDAINLAAFVVGLTTPTVIGTPISFAVSFAAGTAREMQRRWQTNTFLDTANDKIFKPRGLYAMILTYKPGKKSEPIVEVNLDDAAAARNAQGEGAQKKKMMRFKGTEAGTSRGEMSIPQAAPLIYPVLEEQAASEIAQSNSKQPEFTSYRAYMADYLDRRRKAKFAVANPDNPLAQLPEKLFASGFADPNHQMYHHGPINMITGGRVDLWRKKREQRVALAEKQAGRPLTEAERLRASYDRGFTTPAGYARRLISENVLYLVICNAPTEEQMETAKQAMMKT